MKIRTPHWLALPLALAFCCHAPASARPAPPFLADYDSEPRLANGHVDTDRLITRLKELHVTSYYWLVWHAATDWEDLKVFLPKAAKAGLQVWVYLVPPTESGPKYPYSEPFRLDYQRWGEEIARLSLQHTNVTGWIIDDFYANHAFFSPAYIGEMQRRAKNISPRLQFMPLMYFNEISRTFVDHYRSVIDGVVVAYPQGSEEIEHAWAVLNDAAVVRPGELTYPWFTPSQAGDFVEVSQTATVLPGTTHRLRFRERDDFQAATAGYHFKQVLVNGKVVWEQDVAGGTNVAVAVLLELDPALSDSNSARLAFRLLDKQGVSNFGVRWSLVDLEAQGLELKAPLREPELWQVEHKGAFTAGFGNMKGGHSFHVPFVVMTAGDVSEFKLRHGEPASPERIAAWVQMCLDCCHRGKCEGVVTYCLDKKPGSAIFDLTRDAFGRFRF